MLYVLSKVFKASLENSGTLFDGVFLCIAAYTDPEAQSGISYKVCDSESRNGRKRYGNKEKRSDVMHNAPTCGTKK